MRIREIRKNRRGVFRTAPLRPCPVEGRDKPRTCSCAGRGYRDQTQRLTDPRVCQTSPNPFRLSRVSCHRRNTELLTPAAALSPATGTSDRLAAPTVAVVITCRNYSEFVVHAIQSVASQSYRWFRCVVVDDASTDESRAIIEDTLARLADDRFLLLSLNKNVGQLAAFRLGLERLAGQFAAFLDADDMWFPRFLECHVRAHLNSVCAAPLSGSDACLVDREGVPLMGTLFYCAKDRSGFAQIPGNDLPDDSCPRVEGDGIVLDSGAALKVRYISRNVTGWHWVNTSAMVFRRDFVDLAIPADGEPKERHADYILASLGHMLGGSLIIPDRLGTYRIHGRNLFAASRRIGSFQINGFEPPGSVQYANDRLVLHVLRNWDVFASLAGAEAIAEGLQRFLAANRFRELAKAANVDDDVERVLDRADRARRAYRYRLKRYLIGRYLALAAGARSGWRNA